jgi:uncharacterized membrane protein HdeD (DUF308 family)
VYVDVQSLKVEWQRFRADAPGERFRNHHDRAQSAPKAARVVQLVLGVLLIAVGIVLCFIPGPGLLVLLFGLGSLSSLSRGVARTLDRLELGLRSIGRRWKRRWKRRRQQAT